MSKITWDDTGERLYETGVNQGVLYPRAQNGLYPLGVPWNGLTGVTENPTGAEATKLYADNINYATLMSAEEFGATIEAYTYPDEFAACDGSAAIAAGVFVGQQARQPFGMSYKTILGNDTELDEFGYKLHLIYGAQASPSDKAYATVNESPEAITFSWEVKTTPVSVTGFKPTASLTITSTKVDAGALEALEDILYGTVGADPRLPLPDEVAALFAGGAPSAVALSTIVPADDAPDISVATNIVMTFNNAITYESVVVTSAAGVIVAGTKSWNSARKILTFVPTAPLSAATTYIVAIAGVVDVYNQALAPTVKNFTTAA